MHRRKVRMIDLYIRGFNMDLIENVIKKVIGNLIMITGEILIGGCTKILDG